MMNHYKLTSRYLPMISTSLLLSRHHVGFLSIPYRHRAVDLPEAPPGPTGWRQPRDSKEGWIRDNFLGSRVPSGKHTKNY